MQDGGDSHMAIGLASGMYPDGQFVGWNRGSMGFHGDDGNFFVEQGSGATTCSRYCWADHFVPVNYLIKVHDRIWQTGDIVGMGIEYAENRVFVVHNGAIVHERKLDGFSENLATLELRPTVTLTGKQWNAHEVRSRLGHVMMELL